MNKKMYYLLRTLQISTLIVVSAIISYQLISLENRANDMKYQQTARFSSSLTNLAAAEATRYIALKKPKNLQLLINDLSQDPIVQDATIYDHLGEVLYQSEDSLPLPILLNINSHNDQRAKGVIPYIAELYNEGKKIGYLRISLEEYEMLNLIEDYQQKSLSTLFLLLTLAFIAGTVLMALFFKKIETAYYNIGKGLKKLLVNRSQSDE